jgi:hypothetical protein
VCISNARSASTESQSDSEKFREKKGNLGRVQGVHNIKKRLSIEEQEQINTRWTRRMFFQEILRSELSKSRECKVCMGDQNPSKDEAQKG